MQKEHELLITIGQITTTQGLNGEIRVLPLTDFPQRFSVLRQVILNQKGKISTWDVESARPHKRFILLKLAGMDDRHQASAYKQALVQIPETEVMPLPEGQYYIFQIVGLSVYLEDGLYLGKVKEVFATGSNDVYRVINTENKEFLIPALREVVKEIDLQNQKMLICPLPGLLEL